MKKSKLTVVQLLIAAFLAYAVLLPLARMFLYMREVDLARIFSSPTLWTAIQNSLVVTAVSTLISISIAMLLAFCITRSNIKFKGVFGILLTLPMLIPSISHGMGLVMLLGSNGVLTRLLNLPGNIYGFWGIVAGSVLYSFPVAYLMLADVLKYEDVSSYEAATVLGIPRARQFASITLRYLRKPLISVVFATFTLIVTDYGVPMMVGGQYMTLPVMMYQEVIGLLDFGKGGVIGALLLLPAVASFVIDTLNKDNANQSYVTKPWSPQKSRFVNGMSYVFCLAVSLFVLLPVVSFVFLTFVEKYPVNMTLTLANIIKSMGLGAGQYLLNSLIIALFVVLIGVTLSYLVAYLTARVSGKMSRILHLVSITSLAIPGIVLGLSYVLFFNGSIIYGTLAILIMVNMVHFFASPYLMAYNSLSKINGNLEAVGMSLGIGRLYIVRDVLIPQSLPTIIEMASYFFINSMMTISAVSFLSNINNKPLSLMIPGFEAQMLLECAAFVSLLILLVNLVAKGLFGLAKNKLTAEG